MEGHRPFLVVFTADWLGEGTIMDAIVKSISWDLHEKMSFYRMDFEKCRNIFHQLGIQELPALFFFRDGESIDHISGLMPKHALLGWLNQLIGDF